MRLIVSLVITVALVLANERTKPVFRLEHSMAYKLRKHLLNRGWVDGAEASVTVEQNPDFLWDREYYLPVRVTNPKQIYNRISNYETVCNKTGLVLSLRSLYEREPSLDLYSFVPRTYVINDANESHDLERFIADFNRTAGRKEENNLYEPLPAQTIDGTRNVWIMKPEYLYGGEGIEIMSTMEEFDAYKKAKGSEGFIIQKYIEDPLLIHGKKFDIRQHAIIARKKPLVLFNRDVAAFKLTQNQYNLTDTKDLYLHVTNYAKQKKAPGYNSEDGFWGLDNFRKYLRDDLKQPKVWDEKIQPKIDEFVTIAMRAWPDTPEGERENSFTWIGIDIMIDKNFNPWLLEVNTNPGLTTEGVPEVYSSHNKGTARDFAKVILDAPAREEWEKPGYPRSNPDLWGSFRLIYSEIQEGYKPSFRPFLSDEKAIDTEEKKKKKKKKLKKKKEKTEEENASQQENHESETKSEKKHKKNEL
eukprot:TRINITY_DN979_c0_g1_i3.p1 TRINITY_DN979_c0_g1~~TRINITY_DN979_c0_g1_i3.p1  ORF type:complete len:473 (-),score=72.13 TRINITY_DN979_c0_g1_i3:147-1565(-)